MHVKQVLNSGEEAMALNPCDMTGKVVVVTGGNAGIGLGFARGIAKGGGDVVIWGRRPDRNEGAVADLKQYGTRVIGAPKSTSQTRRGWSMRCSRRSPRWAGSTARSPTPG